MSDKSEKAVSAKGEALKEIADLAGKARAALVRAVDKNGDGKIDAADFGLSGENIQETKRKVKGAAVSAGQGIKSGAMRLGDAIGEAKTEMERKSLRPAFGDDLDQMDFGRCAPQLPVLICIVERDKRRGESSVCAGSVGYWTTVKGVDILNLYEESARELDLRFAPAIVQTFYYTDPYKQKTYVALDHYFDYFKKERVNELELIAQDLGARNVRITFKEHRKTLVRKNARAGAKAGTVKGDSSYEEANNDYSKIEIAADVHFAGRETPKLPSLIYFKSEGDIEKLIEMRMRSDNPIRSKDYRFQCSTSSGMSEKVAAKLDGVLQQLKCSGTATISSEVQRENRTELEYHIEF